MTIPEIRIAMHRLADQLADPDQAVLLHYLAEQTRRRPYKRKAPAQRHAKVSRAQVLAFFARHPTADYMACATAFGVNTGRVSEKIAGFRT